MKAFRYFAIATACLLSMACEKTEWDVITPNGAELYGNNSITDDNIYLYFAPISRRETEVPKSIVNGEKTYNSPAQSKGDGGFMLDASIGKTFRLSHGRRIGFNLMLTNILNNIKICTGGMEQNRLDTKQEEERTNNAYRFQQSPRKFYANGINGMLLINYQF